MGRPNSVWGHSWGHHPMKTVPDVVEWIPSTDRVAASAGAPIFSNGWLTKGAFSAHKGTRQARVPLSEQGDAIDATRAP